jgi:hypothetical protein
MVAVISGKAPVITTGYPIKTAKPGGIRKTAIRL